jgi:hypothetical protein
LIPQDFAIILEFLGFCKGVVCLRRRISKMAEKRVYFFGGGKAEGNAKMKELLGGKGANLAEMTDTTYSYGC